MQDFIINVNKGGNDATGDGSDEKPYLTIGKAHTVAKTLALSASQFALVLIGPGQYNENVLIPAFVFDAALDPGGNTVVVGTGVGASIALDPNWLTTVGGALGGAEAVFTASDVIINYTGAIAFCFFTFGAPVTFGNAISVTGDPANGGGIYLPPGSSCLGPVTITGANMTSQGMLFSGSTITLASTAVRTAQWTSEGDTIGVTAISLDATAGQNVTAIVDSTVSGGSLALHDGGGGVTAYIATATAIPTNVVQTGGAAYPQRKTGPNAIAAGAAGQVITTVGGIAVWAAAGGSVTWADDLSTSTNTDQWVSAISGANGLGGAVPLGTNVTLSAAAGGRSMIDLTLANASFGDVIGHRLLTDLGDVDTTVAVPLTIGPVGATRIDFLSTPSFRMNSQAFFTGAGVSLQVGTLALGAPDVGSGQGVLALHLAATNPTTVPAATGLLWEDDGATGLHYSGPSGFGSSFFDEMIAPTWGANAANSQQKKRVKIGGFVRTVGAVVANIGPSLDLSTAGSMVNVKFELAGRVQVAGGGAQFGDVQAAYTCAAFKNVAGVVSQPTTHALGVLEQQYDPSMNPATVGIVTSPIVGTTLQFQVSGVAGATIDWTIEGDAFYN